jgi:hypothetical protein
VCISFLSYAAKKTKQKKVKKVFLSLSGNNAGYAEVYLCCMLGRFSLNEEEKNLFLKSFFFSLQHKIFIFSKHLTPQQLTPFQIFPQKGFAAHCACD